MRSPTVPRYSDCHSTQLFDPAQFLDSRRDVLQRHRSCPLQSLWALGTGLRYPGVVTAHKGRLEFRIIGQGLEKDGMVDDLNGDPLPVQITYSSFGIGHSLALQAEGLVAGVDTGNRSAVGCNAAPDDLGVDIAVDVPAGVAIGENSAILQRDRLRSSFSEALVKIVPGRVDLFDMGIRIDNQSLGHEISSRARRTQVRGPCQGEFRP